MDRELFLLDEQCPSTSKTGRRRKRSRDTQETKTDKKQPLLDEDGPSTSKKSKSMKYSRVTQEQSIDDVEQLDHRAVPEEKFEKLHEAIEEGNVEKVREIVDNHADELYFSYDDISALKKAFQCKKYEIISYLIRKGAKFVGSEEEDVKGFDINLTRLNYLLFQYNKKSEMSCVYRLMYLSQSPQVLDGEKLKILMSMYRHFFDSDIIKVLMNVLESVDFDLVFDFDSDKVNRVHRLCNEEAEVFGLTLTNVGEIFIGAKNLLSDDPRKRAKVYGVVAEELCHLALTVVFENDAKPYREEDSWLIHEFCEIVDSVESLKDRLCHIESVIEDVYQYYCDNQWECELIARIPHVIGIYGEKSGRKIFQESSELYRLLIFYENNVLPKCREFVSKSLNTKSDRMMKQLTKKNDFISFTEKRVQPLKEDFPSFRDCAVVEEGVYVISANCIKLCALHVYHELKPVYGEQLERKCLFFDSKCFEKKRDVIVNALKCKLCDYLVLVVDDKDLNPDGLSHQYLKKFRELESEGMNIVIISNSNLLGPEFFVEYEWDNLTENYKEFRCDSEYVFKGKSYYLSVEKDNVSELFSDQDIIHTMNGDLIEVRDSTNLYSQGYNPKIYVDRQVKATIINEDIFKPLPDNTRILIYGLHRNDFKKFSIDECLVQQLKGSDDEIQRGKQIFIGNQRKPMSFKDFIEKTRVKNCICVQYDGKMFYLMNSVGDVCKKFEREIRQTEEEMIDLLKSNKSLIISDNAGCGKSTVMSRLIWHVQKKFYNSWLLRVDLNKFSIQDDCFHSEENDANEVFEEIFKMLGLENGFEKSHFRSTHDADTCFIFLDAFDEIPSQYRTKALKLISFLRSKTSATIIITTRMHHQQELEETINTFSHQLVPFDNSTQVNYLGKFWKWRLKFPNGEEGQNRQKDKKAISQKIESIIGISQKENSDSEGLILSLKEIISVNSVRLMRTKIDDLHLNRLANSLLKKLSLDKEIPHIMGIPLHLFMIGVIYFDGNFNVEISSDIYGIYSEFVERKILIYVKEKQMLMRDGRLKKSIIEKEKRDAYKIHIGLAKELIEKGRIDSKISEEDKELYSELGIVFVKGAKVDFIHHTFAEFFLAESTRLDLNKKGFTEMLFEKKYKVTTMFLANSLEKSDFENLTNEFFMDLDFFLDVLKQFVTQLKHDFSFFPMFQKPDSHEFSAKIVKRLLEKFEKKVDSEMLEVFVQKIGSELTSLENWFMIGGCITSEMSKMFLDQNFNVNLRMIFGVARFYSKPEKVIDVLNKCISTADICKTNESANEEILLKIFKLRGGNDTSLFDYALSNGRMEIFANILKVFKENLEHQQFVDVILKSEAYEKARNILIKCADTNRAIEFIRTLRSVLNDTVGLYFDKNYRLSILRRSLLIEDESKNGFEEIINLFKECFQIENLKEDLVSCDSDGNYLIHYVVTESKNVIKNLNVFDSILDDKNEKKRSLMFKDGNSCNMFHLAAKDKGINFGEIVTLYDKDLERAEIKEMLINCDEDGDNVLHLLFLCNSSENITEYLNLIKNYLDEKELYDELRSKNKYSMNIFHHAAFNYNEINNSVFELRLNKSDIKELLIERDENGKTFLHWGANVRSTNLVSLLNYSFEILKDEGSQFEELILAKDNFGRTFLHLFVELYLFNFTEEFVNEVINSVREKVSGDIFKELLRTVENEDKKTCLQVRGWHSKEIIECFEKVLEKNLFEELLWGNESDDECNDE